MPKSKLVVQYIWNKQKAIFKRMVIPTWPVITDVDGARRIECSAIKPKALEARGEKYN